MVANNPISIASCSKACRQAPLFPRMDGQACAGVHLSDLMSHLPFARTVAEEEWIAQITQTRTGTHACWRGCEMTRSKGIAYVYRRIDGAICSVPRFGPSAKPAALSPTGTAGPPGLLVRRDRCERRLSFFFPNQPHQSCPTSRITLTRSRGAFAIASTTATSPVLVASCSLSLNSHHTTTAMLAALVSLPKKPPESARP